MKHTPGPWTVRGARIYGPPDERSRHVGQAVLLGGVVDERTGWDSSFGHEPGTVDRKVVDATAQANARLMAAAPDLLAALERVVRVADRQTVEFDAARAAIAKARGES